MANKIPDGLKSADIAQFVVRGAQLEKFKPVIAYWCDFYIINRILSKGLHTEGDDCMTYTTNLMDKLERIKQEHHDDTIHDEVAAKAYIEQFALETFNRAETAVNANKASAQTADTYRASATFLELLGIWPPLEADITNKIKYAKFHALRIVKALKAGEDPNLSNPAPEVEPTLEQPLDPNDPDVQHINQAAAMQPTVEDEHSMAVSPPELSASSVTPIAVSPPSADQNMHSYAEVSPLEPSPDANSRKNSVGGGYFPAVPTFTSEPSAPSLPTAPPDDVSMKSPGLSADPNSFYSAQPPSMVPSPGVTSQANSFQPSPIGQPIPPAAPVMHNSVPVPVADGVYRTDDEAVANAQKHARWAISALNFEDVNTAVKELRVALEALGAR